MTLAAIVLTDRRVLLLPRQHPGLLEPLDAPTQDAAVVAVLAHEQAVLRGRGCI